jgi:hypothetical protein
MCSRHFVVMQKVTNESTSCSRGIVIVGCKPPTVRRRQALDSRTEPPSVLRMRRVS